MSIIERISERLLLRAGIVAMFAVLAVLAGLSLVTQRHTTDLAQRTETTSRLAALYRDIDHWVQEEKSIEREYGLEGSSSVQADHDRAGARVEAGLEQVTALDRSPATAHRVADLLGLQRGYATASDRLFAAVDAEDAAAVQHEEHEVIDPIYGVLEASVEQESHRSTAAGLAYTTELRRIQGATLTATTFAFLGWFTRMLLRLRRRLEDARRAEVERLAQIAMTDPLTGLRNHRAFQEDLARELQRVGRTGDPLALVLFDVDGLKAANDAHGHQAGDERLQSLAEAIRAAQRATDLAYRIGGD